jgi:hypothetical protein
LATVAAVLAFAWFSVRWQLGNMLGELTPSTRSDAGDVAALAKELAPGDPLPQWLLASTGSDLYSAEGVEKTLARYEDVVRLSPNDYRWWIELGRVYEQAELQARAEAAFRRAVDLAPSYTFPRWQFGNFLLRQGRADEAFAELRRTTEQSIAYREQVFSLAWDYFDKDPTKVEEVAADRADVRATLASFFAQRGQAEEALRVWNRLSDEEKAPHQQIARDIAQGLLDRKFFRESLEFARQTGIDPEALPETVSNGGFETFIGQPQDTLFGWRIGRGEGRVDISTDSSVKYQGARSLKMAFKGFVKPDLYNVVQYVAVQPGQRYRLAFMLRTENLKSAGPPLLRITTGPNNDAIAGTTPFPTGTADWREVALEFTVPQNADGISIWTGRAACIDECPITGTIWYDNFMLAKL